MSKDGQTDPTTLEGRMFDGSQYGLRMKDGSVIRVCDFAGPEGVWAKIEQARSKIKPSNGCVTFTGARVTAGSKLEGFAILNAEDIVGLHSYGPGLLGITEARLAKVEETIARMEEGLVEHAARINEIEDELGDEEEGEETPEGQVTPIPLGTTASPEVSEALAVASDDEGE